MKTFKSCFKDSGFVYPCCDEHVCDYPEEHETNEPDKTAQIWCPYCRTFTELLNEQQTSLNE